MPYLLYSRLISPKHESSLELAQQENPSYNSSRGCPWLQINPRDGRRRTGPSHYNDCAITAAIRSTVTTSKIMSPFFTPFLMITNE